MTPPDFVAIHDAARPFVRPVDFTACLGAAAAPGRDGAVLGVAARRHGEACRGPGDSRDRAAQQSLAGADAAGFSFRSPARSAPRRGQPRSLGEECLTDDAAVAERAGLRVVMVPGSEHNSKITTEDDLRRASVMETRTGFGFDVHGFAPGSAVMLGGITIPHAQTLGGHSDADVALHALTDAVLGAFGAGDIGQHFPPSDAQWRGASSDRFLRHAVDLLAARGGRVVHLDLTLICEAPRIGPHREAMVASIARIAGVDGARVSVKATTTEGLGFTGRREGIAAQAVATVEVPRS